MDKTYIDEKGYSRFNDSKKLVHLWVAGKKYPNEDFKGKEVHHLDGDKINNNEENLILLSKKDHYLLEQYQKKYSSKGKYIIEGWAYVMIIIAVAIQLPFFWIPYVTQFITVILVLIGIFGGVKKIK